ncbi:NAD(P)H-binding protein [Actinoplanes sp. NPDC049316]|uniref:NAD(P)H-binding protein n=1 Tax=Actinoplanes sp. NPDC049316 TaxID=3154727 RepID=UPI00342A12F8
MIVVTTPTGAIGRQVVGHLLDAQAPVRVVARDPDRLSPQVRERAEVVPGSHGDADVTDRAFAGADAVFWLVPPNPRAESVDAAYSGFSRPACQAFARHGVQRVVGISALGRGTPVVAHSGFVAATLALDDLIAGTGVSYRALTMPSFMDNLLRQTGSIKDGVFFQPISGDHKSPACANRDIADVAARLLLDDSWSGVDSVPVLGPEDLSFDEMAQIMSEVLGWPVRFQQVPVEAFRARLLTAGMSEAMAQGMADMAVAKENGLDDAEPRTPAASSPTTFRQWCTEVLRPRFS